MYLPELNYIDTASSVFIDNDSYDIQVTTKPRLKHVAVDEEYLL